MYSPRELAEYAAFRSAIVALRALPLPQAQRIAAALARRLFGLGGKRVGYVLANLRIAFPELAESERRAIGRESYVQLAWQLIDVARAAGWGPRELIERVEVEGREHVDAALEKGHGVVGLTAHLGSFEFAMRIAPAIGLPITVIGRPLTNRLLRRDMHAQRTSTGSELLLHRNVAPQMLRALHQGRVVVALNDQYKRRSQGVFVPFFGVRVSTSPGPALIALRAGAPIIPAACVRIGPDRHRLVMRSPLATPDTGDRRKDVEMLTAQGNAAIEVFIRERPEQWMWSQRRFRHSPDLAADPYGGR
ncbi:MAG: lysophospholipid acyltransferase family protein [Myxococcota bacterium]